MKSEKWIIGIQNFQEINKFDYAHHDAPATAKVKTNPLEAGSWELISDS